MRDDKETSNAPQQASSLGRCNEQLIQSGQYGALVTSAYVGSPKEVARKPNSPRQIVPSNFGCETPDSVVDNDKHDQPVLGNPVLEQRFVGTDCPLHLLQGGSPATEQCAACRIALRDGDNHAFIRGSRFGKLDRQ